MSETSSHLDTTLSALTGKKVALVTDAPFSKDYRTQRTVEALVEAGANVEIIDQGLDHEKSQARAHELGAILLSRPQALSSQARLVWHVRNRLSPSAAYKVRTAETLRFLKEIKPDIIHCVNPFDLEACVTAKRALGTQLVYEALEYWPEHIYAQAARFSQDVAAQFDEFENTADAEIDGFITVSKPLDNWYQTRIRTKQRAVIFNSNVPESERESADKLNSSMSSSHGSRLRVVHSGNLFENRNIECAIDVVSLREDIVLTILGDGPHKESLRYRAEDGIARGAISFLDAAPADSLIDILSSQEVGLVLIQPTTLEMQGALPNKVFDYLRSGLAVIATDTEGMRSMPGHESFCLLAGDMTPSDLSEALDVLVNDRQLLANLRESACGLRSDFSNTRMKQRIIDFYDEMLSVNSPTELSSIGSVGIAIAAYNSELSLGRAVRSLQVQGEHLKQIVIVNDGSTDDTSKIAHSLAKADSRITVIDQDNQGAGAARNRAFSALTTEWVGYLDADDEVTQNYLTEMDAFITKHPEYDIYMVNAVRISPDGNLKLYRQLDDPYEVTLPEMIQGSQTVSGAALMKRTSYAESGGFNKHFRVSQDYAYWLNMLAARKRIFMHNAPLLKYYNSPESLCSNPVRTLKATRDILDAFSINPSLSDEQRDLVLAAVSKKESMLKKIAPIESVRKIVEPLGGEASNRFFRSMFTVAADVRRKIQGKK